MHGANQHDTANGGGIRRSAAGLLILSGLAMLAWCGYVLADEYVAQWAARRAFESASLTQSASRARAGLTPDNAGNGAPRDRAAAQQRGAVVARITIPRLKLSAIVLHGSDDQTLRRAPGHLENTAIPGEVGNAVIAGHRDTFFRPLEHIKIGDDIYLETTTGRFHYTAASTRVVKPQDLSVLDPTDEPTLTLITCFPFWVFGDAPDRFIVRAVGVDDEPGQTFTPAVARLHEAYPLPAPERQPPAAASGAAAPRPAGDAAAVRQAIERFRLAYNARVTSHRENDAMPLSFRSCEISASGDVATASCTGAADTSSREELLDRTFELQRTSAGWAIRSVVVR
jgi:sortase A